jgi:alpha-1,3-glucan synthase
LIAPFDAGTTVKNLFSPYEEYTLIPSSQTFGFEGSGNLTGCLSQFTMPGWGFKAFVPKDKWVGSAPSITGFLPGHDYRRLSTVPAGEKETIVIQLQFSEVMDCTSVTNAISLEANTEDKSVATIDPKSIGCNTVNADGNSGFTGAISTVWTYSATLTNVAHGIHAIVVNNASNAGHNASTGSVDRFLFRTGNENNPMIFPRKANYSSALLSKKEDGSVVVTHNAAGATKFRYSVDFQSHFSDWLDYSGGNTTLMSKNWTGTSAQSWGGEHVYIEYWSSLAASSNHFQHGDLGNNNVTRRIPHMHLQGPFNQYSYDTGIPANMQQHPNGTWYYDFVSNLKGFPAVLMLTFSR